MILNKMTAWQRQTALFLAASLILIGVFWPTFDAMMAIWMRSGTFTHGFMIFPMSCFLIWERRRYFDALVPQVSLVSAVLFLGCSLLWLLAALIDVLVVQQFALVSMMILLVSTLFGWQVFYTFLFPLMYLYFMVPFGEFLVPRLMEFTAIFTVKMVQLSDIPVFQDGLMISLPTGEWQVVEACSGIRYLIALLALGTFYAYSQYTLLWKRLLFVILCFGVAVLANGLRAYGIVMIGHLSGMKYATGVDHLVYGWVFFGVLCLLLFWLGRYWQDPVEANPIPATNIRPSALMPTVFVLLVGLVGMPVLLSQLRQAPSSVDVTIAPIVAKAPWVESTSNPAWSPRFQGANQSFYYAFRQENQQVDVFLAYYYAQTQEAELINSKHRPYDATQWQRVSKQVQTVDLGNTQSLEVTETRLKSPLGQERVIWHWYVVGGYAVNQPLWAKMLELLAIFQGNSAQSGVLVVKADVLAGQTMEDASAALLVFMQSHFLRLMQSFIEVEPE